MGCAVVVYLTILIIDLLVGGGLIVWKCVLSEDVEDECKMATGGAVGSLIIWLILMLVCPCFATRVDRENFKQQVLRYVEKLRPHKTRELYIESQVYRPTTVVIDTCHPDTKSTSENDTCNTCERATDVESGTTDRLVPGDGPTEARHDVVYMFNDAERHEHHLDSVT